MSKIKSLCTETVSGIIDSIVDALWPNGLYGPPEVDEKGVPVIPEKPLQAWERKPSLADLEPSILQPGGEGLLTRHRSEPDDLQLDGDGERGNPGHPPSQAAAMAAAASFPPMPQTAQWSGAGRSHRACLRAGSGTARIQRTFVVSPPEHTRS